MREALVALKGPLGNVPAFRTKLQELLDDEQAREKLAGELEMVLSSTADAASDADADAPAEEDDSDK